MAIMVLSYSCLLSLTRAHARIYALATLSRILNPFRPTSDCRQQTFSTRNIKCQPTDRSLKAQNAPQRHFWRDLSVFVSHCHKSKKRTSAWLQMRLKVCCRQGLRQSCRWLFAFRNREFCQSFDLLTQRCRCQRFASHDFEHIQTVIDLFQSLFHRLQIPL